MNSRQRWSYLSLRAKQPKPPSNLRPLRMQPVFFPVIQILSLMQPRVECAKTGLQWLLRAAGCQLCSEGPLAPRSAARAAAALHHLWRRRAPTAGKWATQPRARLEDARRKAAQCTQEICLWVTAVLADSGLVKSTKLFFSCHKLDGKGSKFQQELSARLLLALRVSPSRFVSPT